MAREFDTAIGGTPSMIVDFYEEATFDGLFVTGVILETFGFLLLLAFVVGLAHVVQGSRDRAGWVGTVIAALATLALVLGLVSVFSHAAGTFRASNGGLVADGYVVLSDIRQLAYWVSLPAWALIFLTSGLLMALRQSFPPWLGWAAVLIGIAHIAVLFFDSVDVWDVATGLGGLWFMVTAVYMLIRPDRYPQPASETP